MSDIGVFVRWLLALVVSTLNPDEKHLLQLCYHSAHFKILSLFSCEGLEFI